MKSGIYAIVNICNNKIYIGQSKSVKQRIARHKSELKHNCHRNIYLQREYSKYGSDCFEFKVLEFCEEQQLTPKEREYISEYQSNNYLNGFNMTDGGENTIWNEEARLKRSGSGNPMYNRKTSDKQKEAARIANLGSSDKLTPEDVIDIKNSILKGVDFLDIANKYQVGTSTIHKIYRVKNWYWVAEELNDKLIEHQHLKHAKVAERNENILHDIDYGLSRKEIMDKYSVTRHVIHDIFRK
jgi:group I intron endonuclease